ERLAPPSGGNMPQTTIFISTRKGLWTLRTDDRARFRLEGPQHLGNIVHHTVLDPRDGRTLLAAMRTGHLGPVVLRSLDGGVTWQPVSGYNDHPDQATWAGGDKDQTPDGGKLHSVLVDPRDPKHLYVGMSGGGFFESTDEGASWRPLSRGVENEYLPKLP